ncbi:hypothetical protein H6CHR_03192 [Variovorax sp. PBL-H6]|uniref:hypothetical protein n=1 Tax=Variovorax sp. PBL-H6 TaxID=434009 RepID=UPI00131671E1|nr:hypothetical protein [Variovorax sp. PBL-H6]VTU29425.1 hypothetical protein H6CHR_03192 [Variovorax sp. PBL-H6]
MSRFRFLILTVEALHPGAFEWSLSESFDDLPGFTPYMRSDRTFSTYESAWESGCTALAFNIANSELHLLADGD